LYEFIGKKERKKHKMSDTALPKIFLWMSYLYEFSCAASVGWAGQRFSRIWHMEASSSLCKHLKEYFKSHVEEDETFASRYFLYTV
jgi:hypothetical protein